MTWLSLLEPLKSRLSGCQVRRRQASSAALDAESRLDQFEFVEVGDSRLLWAGEKAPLFDEFIPPGPNMGPRRLPPCGEWNGLPPDGTLSRRPGVLDPAYMLCAREWDELGDATPEPQWGLFWPVEKVADVGVLKSLGEAGRYPYGADPSGLRYDSRESLDRGSAITRGGGRRRASLRG